MPCLATTLPVTVGDEMSSSAAVRVRTEKVLIFGRVSSTVIIVRRKLEGSSSVLWIYDSIFADMSPMGCQDSYSFS